MAVGTAPSRSRLGKWRIERITILSRDHQGAVSGLRRPGVGEAVLTEVLEDLQ
jgi:hypothetical protein